MFQSKFPGGRPLVLVLTALLVLPAWLPGLADHLAGGNVAHSNGVLALILLALVAAVMFWFDLKLVMESKADSGPRGGKGMRPWNPEDDGSGGFPEGPRSHLTFSSVVDGHLATLAMLMRLVLSRQGGLTAVAVTV